MAVATEQLLAYRERHPAAKLRILTLTDGQDEGSAALPTPLMAELVRHAIIVDAVVISDVGSYTLDAMGELSGGTWHRLTSWVSSQQLFEADALVSFNSRLAPISKLPSSKVSREMIDRVGRQLRARTRQALETTIHPPMMATPSEVQKPRAASVGRLVAAASGPLSVSHGVAADARWALPSRLVLDLCALLSCARARAHRSSSAHRRSLIIIHHSTPSASSLPT